MYCPKCKTEYRDGFLECSDCRVPLAPGFPPEPPRENITEQLVTVLEAHDTFALSLAKASLEEAGINYIVSGEDPRNIAGVPPGFAVGIGATPLWKCSCQIQVASQDEAEARALVEPLEEPHA